MTRSVGDGIRRVRAFLAALAKSMCVPNEGQEDVFMKE